MNAPQHSDHAFSPAIKEAQRARGSREAYARQRDFAGAIDSEVSELSTMVGTERNT